MVWTSSRANSAGSAGSLPASACVSTWSRQAPMRIDATTSGCAHSSMRPSSCSAPMYDDAVREDRDGARLALAQALLEAREDAPVAHERVEDRLVVEQELEQLLDPGNEVGLDRLLAGLRGQLEQVGEVRLALDDDRDDEVDLVLEVDVDRALGASGCGQSRASSRRAMPCSRMSVSAASMIRRRSVGLISTVSTMVSARSLWVSVHSLSSRTVSGLGRSVDLAAPWRRSCGHRTRRRSSARTSSA